jgi:mannose-6-phosphate isomerase-like protein (cupin superfamily)
MARVYRQEDGKRLVLPGRISQEIICGESGARGVTVRLVEVPPLKPGEAERGPHVHHGFEECIYVLAGEGVTHSGGKEYPLKAGDTLLVPAEEKHKTICTGREPLKLLCFFPNPDIRPGTQEFPPSTPTG